MDDATLPLEGLYLHLVRAGLPVSVRDYEDLLAALRRGHGSASRERLRWLCHALWARTDEEHVRLDVVFDRLAAPPQALVQHLTGRQAPRSAPASETPDAGPTPDERPGPAQSALPVPVFDFGAAGGGGTALPAVRHGRAAPAHRLLDPPPPLPPRALAVAWRRLRQAQRGGPKTELDVEATVAERCRRGWLLV